MRLREIITPTYNQQLDEDWQENLSKAKDWVYDKLFSGSIPILVGTAATVATAIISKHPILRIVEFAFGANFLIDHYTQLQSLHDQYARYKAGDYKTELFGNASQKDAEQIAYSTRNKILGEMALSVGALTRSTSKVFAFLSKLTGKIGSGVGKIGGSIMGSAGGRLGATIGKAAGLPFGIVSALSKIMEGGVKGAAFQAFINSPLGQDFLNTILMQYITTGTANVGSDMYEKLLSFLKSIGIDVPDELDPDIKNPKTADTAAQSKLSSSRVISDNPQWKNRPIQVAFDKNNNKIMYINDIQVTDAEGYQKVGDRMINHFRDTARVANNIPDPTANIPKKPGVNYNF